MAVVGFASETDVAAAGDFFLDAAEVGQEFGVVRDAEGSVFEGGAEAVGHFFFEGGGEGDGFDFPAVTLAGAFGELHAQACGIDAGAFELGEFEETVKSELDFGEGFVLKFDSATIPEDIADFFADVEDAQVILPGYIDAEEEWAVKTLNR